MKILVSENCNLLSSGQFVMYCHCLRVCCMYYIILLCFLFFLLFSLLSFFFFFSCFFSLRCLLMITIFQFYFPFVLTIFFSFFFSSQNFSSSIFSTFQTYVSQHFFLTQLIFYLLGLFQYNFHLIL